MRVFQVEATEITPKVILNKGTSKFLLQGKCLPEDVKRFFTPVIEWFDEYLKDPNPETIFILDFDYFNTASSKMILILLSKMRDFHKLGRVVKFTWNYGLY